MIAVLAEHFGEHDVEVGKPIRIAAHNVKWGVTSDEGDGDEWPSIRKQIVAADILIFGTPIWMGQPSSVAIYQQFRQGSREAALRLAELHAAFNAADMQDHRDLGWKYLESLVVPQGKDLPPDDTRLQAFASWWVCSTDDAPAAPGKPKKGETQEGYDKKQTWAVTAIVNFYVRLENHFAVHADRAPVSDVQFLRATGPFVWRYWEKDIMTFVKACRLKTFADHKDRIVEPYFIAPLERLEARYDRAIAATLPQTIK